MAEDQTNVSCRVGAENAIELTLRQESAEMSLRYLRWGLDGLSTCQKEKLHDSLSDLRRVLSLKLGE